MAESTEIQASGENALVAPIFTSETLTQFSETLNSIEDSACEALSFFIKGKIGVAGGFAKEVSLEFGNLENILQSIKPSSDSVEAMVTHGIKAIHEAESVLSHSKSFALAKLTCNLKDSATSTLLTNALFKSLGKMTVDHMKAYGLPQSDIDKVVNLQTMHAQALSFFETKEATELCNVITQIPNDYDANFQNLHNGFMGVVNTILDPMSLFGPSDALVQG